METILSIVQDPALEPWQKRQHLACAAESLLPGPALGPRARTFLQEGILCDLHEGRAPYRPRYVLPDYAKFMAQGSAYLDLEPPRDTLEALQNLLILYRYVPSITGHPVWLGHLDALLSPFWEGTRTEQRLLESFLVQVDRIHPDAFVHANLGPQDSPVARTILDIERRARKAVPNLSLKVDGATPDDLLLAALETALATGKPYFVNHADLAAELGEDYGIASCYNTLPVGGGSHTLVRLNLAKAAGGCRDLATFLDQRLPAVVEALGEVIAARCRFLVEESRFFEASFLVREGLVSLDRFTAMAGVFGLHECVELLTGGRQMGRDAEADRLAATITEEARRLVKELEAPYCQARDGRFGFHAQSGISEDRNVTAGVRIRIGQEPELPVQLDLAARLQRHFDAGVSEIVLFDATARNNLAGLLKIVRGALSQGLRILAVGSGDSDLVRISGYLVKRRDLLRARREEPQREDTAVLGELATRNCPILSRKVRGLG